MNRWRAPRAIVQGALVSLDQVWRLARAWYAGRADEQWTPRAPAAAQQVFADVGLVGDFWDLSAPSRG